MLNNLDGSTFFFDLCLDDVVLLELAKAHPLAPRQTCIVRRPSSVSTSNRAYWIRILATWPNDDLAWTREEAWIIMTTI